MNDNPAETIEIEMRLLSSDSFGRRFITLESNVIGSLYPPIAKLNLPREILVMIHEEWVIEHFKDLQRIKIPFGEYYFLRPSFLKVRYVVLQIQKYFISEQVLKRFLLDHFCYFDSVNHDLISFVTSSPLIFRTYLYSNE